ncbi:hypothetical protein BXZ70DRAFT_618385 [Cristinia sonorae]|uniref:Uncharacterized protein n=1 Tax=Cristinia sonorae TaxID=1940300 RepID=A0A8K0UVZ3_9AGAR|nr:hypothetical protein BXZ70DRAFT_618385 [Cristinia sonorae]
MVFEFAVPPAALLDPYLTGGPGSHWCHSLRMKKVLTRVCKGWRRTALWFLYKDVTLRRAGQVFLFSRTLQTRTMGPLVHSISLLCYVPDHIRPAVSRAVADILTACTQLNTLRFGHDFLPHYFLQSLFSMSVEDEAFLSAVHTVGPRIQGFYSEHNFRDYSVTYPLRFLENFPNVQSLSLALHEKTWDSNYSALRFPHLRALSLTFLDIKDLASHIDILQRWDLPALRTLSIDAMYCTTPPDSYMGSLVSFFRTHGQNVLDLDFGPSIATRGDYTLPGDAPLREAALKRIMESIEQMVSLCPCLRYLALPCSLTWETSLGEILKARNPHIYVDLWGIPSRHDDYVSQALDSSSLEGYRGVRFIDWSLYNHDMGKFTRTTTSSAPIIFRVYNTHIVQTHFAIFSSDVSTLYLRRLLGMEAEEESNEGNENDNSGGRDESEHREQTKPQWFTVQKWKSGLPEFDFEERLEYAYVVDSDSDSGSTEEDLWEDAEGNRDTRRPDSGDFQPREEDEEEEEDDDFIKECIREAALELKAMAEPEESLTEADILEMYSATLDVGCVEYVPWPVGDILA